MTRYLYLMIGPNAAPVQRHFTDRSAGLKHLFQDAGLDPNTNPDRVWVPGLKQAHIISPTTGCHHYLTEIEIY